MSTHRFLNGPTETIVNINDELVKESELVAKCNKHEDLCYDCNHHGLEVRRTIFTRELFYYCPSCGKITWPRD